MVSCAATARSIPSSIITLDSQSDSKRAAQVTGDLINNNGVDIITRASHPDTVARWPTG